MARSDRDLPQIKRRGPATGDDGAMSALFATPAAGFDHPIDILDGCHQRIRRHCALIGRLAEHLAAEGGDDRARAAARSIVRFFETAGANHHRDEEDDLFPTLERVAPSLELNAVRDLLHRLRKDHRKLDGLWAQMRARLGEIAAGDAARIDPDAAAAFALAYDRHIALEEAELLPLARRLLDANLVARLGERMARRRGASPHS